MSYVRAPDHVCDLCGGPSYGRRCQMCWEAAGEPRGRPPRVLRHVQPPSTRPATQQTHWRAVCVLCSRDTWLVTTATLTGGRWRLDAPTVARVCAHCGSRLVGVERAGVGA